MKKIPVGVRQPSLPPKRLNRATPFAARFSYGQACMLAPLGASRFLWWAVLGGAYTSGRQHLRQGFFRPVEITGTPKDPVMTDSHMARTPSALQPVRHPWCDWGFSASHPIRAAVADPVPLGLPVDAPAPIPVALYLVRQAGGGMHHV